MADNLVKAVTVKISVDGLDNAKLKIGQITASAKNLSELHPEIAVKIDAARALLEARLLRAGLQAELSKTINVRTDTTGGGFLGRVLGAGSGGVIGSVLAGSAAGGIGAAGYAAIAAAAAGVVAAVGGIISSVAAAGIGMAAFGALAIPTFTAVSTAVAAVGAATTKVARDKAWDAIPKGLVPIVKGVLAIQTAWDNMAAKLQPVVAKIMAVGLQIANKLLPMILPFAKSAGNAILDLLKQFDKFASSPGFKSFMASMLKLSGPAIKAIGQGLGQVAAEIGKMLQSLGNKNGPRLIADTFNVITAAIKVLDWLLVSSLRSWDRFTGGIAEGFRNIKIWASEGALFVIRAIKFMTDSVLHFLGNIIDGIAHLASFLPFGIGNAVKKAAAWFDRLRGSSDATFNGMIGSVQGYINNLNNIPRQIQTNILLNYQHIGGPVPLGAGHAAAGGYASGLTLVGERGPELIAAPAGSYVYTNAQSQRMMGGGITAAEMGGMIGALIGRLDDLISVTAAAPAVTGAALGAGLNRGARAAGYASMYPNRTGGSR